MQKKAYGYIRRSVERENLSLLAQEKAIQSFAESQGWLLLKIFRDIGESGRGVDRLEYQRMLRALKTDDQERPDLILVAKLDRISRSLKDILILVEDQLDSLGIGLKSVTESFDSSTSEGRLMLSMLGGFAEFERKRIVERMMDGKQELAIQGGWNGGHVPYGYKIGPQGLEVAAEEAAIVRRIFNLYADKQLSSMKLKYLTSCPLHRDSIQELLSNPVYAGLLTYGGRVVKGVHEPIVSVRLFNKVQQAKLEKSRRYPTKKSLFRICGSGLVPLTFTDHFGAS